MEQAEKNDVKTEDEIDKSAFQDEPFDAVQAKKGAPFPPLFWLQWALMFLVGFYFVSIYLGGFAGMHRYGVQGSTGINYIFLIPKLEKIFYAAMFMLLPTAVLLTLFLERYAPGNFLARLSDYAKGKKAVKTAVALMILAGIAITFLTLFIFEQTPISDDENVYLFQTRIMAQGKLTLESKPGQDSLYEDNVFLVNNGKIFGQYPFGHSAVLLLGYMAGFTHLTQVIFAMLTILGVFFLGRELYGSNAGLISAILVAVSPMFLFTASTLLSHINTLFFLTWFGYFALKTIREEKLLYPILCGLAFGGAFHIRSATTLLVAMPAALMLAFIMIKNPGKNLKKIIGLGVTVSAAVALMLALNYHVNGDLFHTNYHAAWIGKTQFDSPFGFDKGAWRIIHTPLQGLLNLINNFLKLNFWVFGWPIGILFVIVWGVTPGRRIEDYLLFVPILLTFIAYFFYFWPGIADTGPVLYFELLLPIALLSAKGIQKTPALLSRIMDENLTAGRTVLFVIASIFTAIITFHFYNGKAMSNMHETFAEPYDEMSLPEGEKAVVFMDYYLRETNQKSWVAGRINTHPDLGDKVLYVLDYGRDKNDEFMNKYYPDHNGYVFQITHDIPKFMPLSDYTVRNNMKNYPDAR